MICSFSLSLFHSSGKTSTICFVIRLLVAHGKRVLVTSYTNAAVDNVLTKLIEKGVSAINMHQPLPAVVRVGRTGDVHGGVVPILTSTIALNLEKDTSMLEDDLDISVPSATFVRRTVESAKIVGVTALSAPRSAQLLHQHFDVVIVDEAGQINQPAIIGALMAADTFILVGDHMQLPPLVNSELAERGGMYRLWFKSASIRAPFSCLTCGLHHRIRSLPAKTSRRCTPHQCNQAELPIPHERGNMPVKQ